MANWTGCRCVYGALPTDFYNMAELIGIEKCPECNRFDNHAQAALLISGCTGGRPKVLDMSKGKARAFSTVHELDQIGVDGPIVLSLKNWLKFRRVSRMLKRGADPSTAMADIGLTGMPEESVKRMFLAMAIYVWDDMEQKWGFKLPTATKAELMEMVDEDERTDDLERGDGINRAALRKLTDRAIEVGFLINLEKDHGDGNFGVQPEVIGKEMVTGGPEMVRRKMLDGWKELAEARERLAAKA